MSIWRTELKYEHRRKCRKGNFRFLRNVQVWIISNQAESVFELRMQTRSVSMRKHYDGERVMHNSQKLN